MEKKKFSIAFTKYLKINTRSSSKIHKEQARTDYKKISVQFKGCEIWNNLPISIKNSKSIEIFKKKIKKYYLDLLD